MDDSLISPDQLLSHRLKAFARAKWFPTKAAQRLNFMQQLCLDVFALLLTVAGIILLIIVKVIHFMLMILIKKEKKRK